MTDRELMQQALRELEGIPCYKKYGIRISNAIKALKEGLAHCDRCGKRLGGEGDIHTCTPPAAAHMTEFEEAVAAVDNTLHYAIDHWQDRALKAEALLARQEQEPMWWAVVGKVIASVPHLRSIAVELLPEVPVPPEDSLIYTTPPAAQRTEQEWFSEVMGGALFDFQEATGCDTAEEFKAQRQWVGLTEYQRAECWYGANCFEQKPPPPNDDYAITIEAKLRSKNT
jgi:hypothetical protein